VPRPEPQDAAVVRCSACGAPRQEQAGGCGFCGADFTLHERDLHTICPDCMARVSDRARYCHHCATPLVPEPLGEATGHACPVCGDGSRLTSRSLGRLRVSALECPRCAGLWVGRASFAVLLDRARRQGAAVDDREVPPAAPASGHAGALYRPCPECGVLMHRRNYGRRSGVIVDSCVAHGIWFDAHELDALLRWVGRGGEAASARRQAEERRQLERQHRLGRELRGETTPLAVASDDGRLLETLGRLVARLFG
jgi:Zn-finger nucleic acid-binding protein